MVRNLAWRVATPLLLAAGFAGGVAFVGSCGGSGGGAQAGVGASQGVRHVFHASVPVTGTANASVFSQLAGTTFTPAAGSDQVLAFRMHGTIDVADGDATVHLRIFHPAGDFTVASARVPVGASQDFFLMGSFPALGGTGPVPVALRLEVAVQGPPVGDTTVTVTSLEIEAILLEGVVVSDPSPRFS